jgi:hypothetical protein
MITLRHVPINGGFYTIRIQRPGADLSRWRIPEDDHLALRQVSAQIFQNVSPALVLLHYAAQRRCAALSPQTRQVIPIPSSAVLQGLQRLEDIFGGQAKAVSAPSSIPMCPHLATHRMPVPAPLASVPEEEEAEEEEELNVSSPQASATLPSAPAPAPAAPVPPPQPPPETELIRILDQHPQGAYSKLRNHLRGTQDDSQKELGLAFQRLLTTPNSNDKEDQLMKGLLRHWIKKAQETYCVGQRNPRQLAATLVIARLVPQDWRPHINPLVTFFCAQQ